MGIAVGEPGSPLETHKIVSRVGHSSEVVECSAKRDPRGDFATVFEAAKPGHRVSAYICTPPWGGWSCTALNGELTVQYSLSAQQSPLK